jgi:hypothetical protein
VKTGKEMKKAAFDRVDTMAAAIKVLRSAGIGLERDLSGVSSLDLKDPGSSDRNSPRSVSDHPSSRAIQDPQETLNHLKSM